MIKIKKLVILVALLYPLFLASCQPKESNVSVSYILDGKVVEVIELKSGDKAPQLDEYADVEWQYNGEKYDFDLKVEKDIILIGKIGTLPSNKFVDILSLTAIQESLVAKQSCVLTSLIMSDDTKEEKITDFSHNQYIVMYKSQSEITFTIKLNNPKGESIDAIELTCDDPNAQIMVDGEYKPIQFNENSEGVKSRIVNWAQEDPYEKVYYIKTTSMDDINTLRVIDLKVNGEWQNQALSNDELKIYKMNEEDLKWVFLKNTPEYYQFAFENSDRISNLVVRQNGKIILPEEKDGYMVYTVVSGKVTWEYDYTFDGFTAHWSDVRDVELVEIVYDEEVIKPYGMGLFTFAGMHTKVWINSFIGTDLDGLIYINKESDETKYFLEFDGRTFNILSAIFCPEEDEKCYLYFGNSKYYINVENRTLDFVE